MAIHTEKIELMSSGIQKGIATSAMKMVLDNLQKSQYAYPIKSCTREIMCNGIDSIAEKTTALSILNGAAKEEDYFVHLEGDIYEDSHFDISYYDRNWLSGDNTVEMRYICGRNMQKDKVEFRDNGVGMSIKRLAGYFQLGFSTKRLSKLPFGKFGIGAKSPLSTGCNYYTTESRYNGQLFRFNIYAHDVDSLIPKFDLERNRENQYHVIDNGTKDGYKVYWEPTTLKNGVTISMEVKKHHRGSYIDAVKSQLLYFDNIKLVIEHEDGREEFIDYKAPVLYEDDYIVLSDNQYYTKPHLLINKVNYGYVDWKELELEDRNGNIGIKVAPEDIEVDPSRERVLWTEKTKDKLLESFKKVVDIASAMIQEELKQDDIIKWLRTCYSLAGAYSRRNGVLGRLANIVDLSSAKPKFHRDPRIRYDQKEILEGMYMRVVTMEREQRQNKYRNVVKRKEKKSLGPDISLPIILMNKEERASNRKDKWLLQMYSQGFVTIHAPMLTREDMVLNGISDEVIENLLVFRNKGTGDKYVASDTEIWNYITESEEVILYKDVEVPEDFKGTEEEEETKQETEEVTAEEIEEVQVAIIAAEERRKLEGKTLIYTPRAATYGNTAYEMQKLEIKISSINDWGAKEVYYAQDREDEMLQFAALLSRDPYPGNKILEPHRSYAQNYTKWAESKYYHLHQDEIGNSMAAFYCQHFYDAKDVILVKVAKSNVRLYRDFRPIQQFFIRIQNNVITMSNTLIRWNTARILREKLSAAAFLYNFSSFHPEFAQKYMALCAYVDANYRSIDAEGKSFGLNESAVSSLLSHLDKVQVFQEFVASHPEDTGAVAALAQQYFGNRQLQDGMAIEPEIMEDLNQLMDYVSACGTTLNHIPLLTGYVDCMYPKVYTPGQGREVRIVIPEALEQEIKQYLEYKGLLSYNTSFDDTPDEALLQQIDGAISNEEEIHSFTSASYQ